VPGLMVRTDGPWVPFLPHLGLVALASELLGDCMSPRPWKGKGGEEPSKIAPTHLNCYCRFSALPFSGLVALSRSKFSSANPLDEDVTAAGTTRGLSEPSCHCLEVSWLHGPCVKLSSPQCCRERGEMWDDCAGWADPLRFVPKDAFCGSLEVTAH